MAESLGGIESLVNHPVTMSHASIPEQERLKIGITDSLVRLSVGIEDIEDLLADILEYRKGAEFDISMGDPGGAEEQALSL